jgi:16S rRNA processing protein RimM
VLDSREHDGRWIVGFVGVETIEAAERLRDLRLEIPAHQVKPLGPGAYYLHDLVGCQVETTGGLVVGRVEDVHRGAGPALLTVTGPGGEVLVPLVDELCREVDVTARRIVLAPVEGLLELNAVPPRDPRPGPGRERRRDGPRRTGKTAVKARGRTR